MAESSADARAAHEATVNGSRRLTKAMQRINAKAGSYRSPGLQLPVLGADPPAESATTIWALSDGRIRARIGSIVVQVKLEDPGPAVSATSLPVDADLQRYQVDYPATWAASYCPVHGQENGAALGYGSDSSHGNRRIMIGFDAAAIAADLTGAVVRKVSLRLLNRDALSDPVRIHLGVHKSTSAPATFAGTRRDVWTGPWPASGYGDDWHQTTDYVGRSIRDGIAAGLTIDQPDGPAFAGHITWATARLRISYTR